MDLKIVSHITTRLSALIPGYATRTASREASEKHT
jgi:hypothetical protein